MLRIIIIFLRERLQKYKEKQLPFPVCFLEIFFVDCLLYLTIEVKENN